MRIILKKHMKINHRATFVQNKLIIINNNVLYLYGITYKTSSHCGPDTESDRT